MLAEADRDSGAEREERGWKEGDPKKGRERRRGEGELGVDSLQHAGGWVQGIQAEAVAQGAAYLRWRNVFLMGAGHGGGRCLGARYYYKHWTVLC